jgi:hypothetical protein
MASLHLHLKLFKGSTCLDEVSVQLGGDFKLVTSAETTPTFKLIAASDLSTKKDHLRVEAKSGKVYFSHLVEVFGGQKESRDDFIVLDRIGTAGKSKLPSGFMKNKNFEIYWVVRTEKPYFQKQDKTKRSGLGLIKEFFRPLLGHNK